MWIWSHLMKNFLLENFILCAVYIGLVTHDKLNLRLPRYNVTKNVNLKQLICAVSSLY